MNKSYSSSAILGGAIVLIGLLLLIRNIFNIHIPIFTLIISLGLIWLGVMLIRGSIKTKGDNTRTMFGDGKLNYAPGQESYSVVFGSGVLNLQGIRPDTPVHLNVECTFGELKVIAGRDVPILVEGSATFGSLHGPDLRSASFGPYTFTSPEYNPSVPGFTIHARVTFGELRVFYI
jgi:hypothetical protein